MAVYGISEVVCQNSGKKKIGLPTEKSGQMQAEAFFGSSILSGIFMYLIIHCKLDIAPSYYGVKESYVKNH
jgi:hypothetical protein